MSAHATAEAPKRGVGNPDPLRPAVIAYVMSRFPKLTETFILQEVIAMEESGVRVELFPLLRQRDRIVQPEAVRLSARAFYQPFISAPILRSNLTRLLRQPRAYVGALIAVISGTIGSKNYLVGGLAIFPKVVHMAGEIERLGVDHIHCHFANHPALAGLLLQRLTGTPFSFTAHGTDLHVDRHMLCQKVSEAAFVVAISDDNQRVIAAECGEGASGSVRVIHCGVDTRHFAPPTRLPKESSRFSIVCVGTLHEVKGQRFLVEACCELRAAGIDFTCRFIGEGVDRKMLEGLVRDAGLIDQVRFEGARTGPEVAAILRESDVLVAPSVSTRRGQREGIPVALMEAMSTGLSVVASGISGIPELVRDHENGLLVPPGDSAELARVLRRLHDDPSLRIELGRAARATVVRDFDVRRNAEQLRNEIEGTLNRRARADGSAKADVRHPGRQRPFSVALVGPDGAGKTTIARAVERLLPMPVSYLYMGVNPAAGNRLLPTTRVLDSIRGRLGRPEKDRARWHEYPPARSGALTTARSLVRLANRLAEEWYRQLVAWSYLARGRVVLFDRHFYADYYATDIKARRRTFAKRLHGLVLEHVYPKPDLLVYLDAPAHILHERKREGTVESLERKRQEYLEVGRRSANFIVIDADRSLEEVVPMVAAAIIEFAARRARNLR